MNNWLDRFCKCGHDNKLHNMPSKIWFDSYFIPDVCLSMMDSSDSCKCRHFKLDNLRYLEQQYEQSIH
jgi:hypothetical protein